MEFSTNIRNLILNKSPSKVLDLLVCQDIEESFDDRYIGTVIDTSDPLKAGRVKVRTYNHFPANIPDADIPWAIPDFSYAGSKKGSFIVPPVNTKVRVYFDRGDIYCPIYEAKGFNQNDLPDGILTNYPDTMIIYSTDQGEYFSVNRATKVTKLHQASGIDINMANGKIAIGNSNAELLDLMDQILTALITSTVPTSIGPQQLSEVTNQHVAMIKQKLALIKGSL